MAAGEPAGGVGHEQLIATEHAVALILRETKRPEDAYRRILEQIATSFGWQFGAVWEEAPGSPPMLRCADVWCVEHAEVGDFARETRGTVLLPGVGLPGRVWSDGTPLWIPDVQRDSNFPRATAAAAAGLRSAFAFPLRSARGVAGAIEFLAADAREPDAELMAMTEALGSQIGQFVERGRAEELAHEREARLAGILDSALDCIVTIDHSGRVIEFNRAAEETFGYRADDVFGREMAELIIPPSLRDLHRHAFTRLLETDRPRILGHRIEISGMRADGTEFPVELTITRIPLPGRPVFTGFLRDITDRKRAENELRASRQRLVEASAEERRRLERNLHDGAQQRLVSVALALRLARERAGEHDGTEMLDRAAEELSVALEELRELARGIHPAILTERGLAPALDALVARSLFPVRLDAAPEGRLPEAVEAAAYYVVSEALANIAKYAQATEATVAVRAEDGRLLVDVDDNGVGGADAAKGSGIRGLADRVEALDGTLRVVSEPGAGTRLTAEIPLT